MQKPTLNSDLILPFRVEAVGLHGRLVRLGPALNAILNRHDYPEAVAELLGESLVLSATLSAALKYDGIFTLQTKGDGPVSMLVADVTTAGAMRGYAELDKEAFLALEAEAGELTVPRLIGAGHLAFTVDQSEHTDRYQGIVELTGATLAECAQHYFRQSEQLQTLLRLSVGIVDGKWRGLGLMLQHMPQEQAEGDNSWDIAKLTEEESEDTWRRMASLIGTLQDDEALSVETPPAQILYRLFHQDGVRIYPERAVTDTCRCSRERVQTVLRMLQWEEIETMKIDGEVVVTCQFCNRTEHFDDAAIRQIFETASSDLSETA